MLTTQQPKCVLLPVFGVVITFIFGLLISKAPKLQILSNSPEQLIRYHANKDNGQTSSKHHSNGGRAEQLNTMPQHHSHGGDAHSRKTAVCI